MEDLKRCFSSKKEKLKKKKNNSVVFHLFYRLSIRIMYYNVLNVEIIEKVSEHLM